MAYKRYDSTYKPYSIHPLIKNLVEAEQERELDESHQIQSNDFNIELNYAFGDTIQLVGQLIDSNPKDATKLEEEIRDIIGEQIGGQGWFSGMSIATTQGQRIAIDPKTELGSSMYSKLTKSDIDSFIDEKIGEHRASLESKRQMDYALAETEFIDDMDQWQDMMDETKINSFTGLEGELALANQALLTATTESERNQAQTRIDDIYAKMNERDEGGFLDSGKQHIALYNLKTGQLVRAKSKEEAEEMTDNKPDLMQLDVSRVLAETREE